MRQAAPPPATHTDSRALPIFLPGGEEAFLLIHGFTDISDEMRYIAERLWERGYTVSVPRLPGHGTRGEDFITTSWKDWLRRVTDDFFDLKNQHEKVHLLGLSMGALLALLIAGRFETGKIVLAAPAIITTSRFLKLAPLFRLFIRKQLRKGYTFSGPIEHSPVSREYWRFNWPGPAASLLRLQSMTRKILPRVKADTLIIVSEKDGTVPPKAAGIIEKKIGSARTSRLVLQESGHVVVNDCEREKVADAVIRWMAE
jgi:carboxylesterase